MDRFGSRRSHRRSSFESGAIERDLSPKHSPARSTQQAVCAWVESLEIRRLLAADLSVATTGPSTTPTYFLDQATAQSLVTQSASVSSAGTDPNLSNNSASQTVAKESDLVPTITGPTVAAAGTLVNYVLSISNIGDLPGGQVTVTFNIPANAPLVSMGSSTFSIMSNVTPGMTGPVTLVLHPALRPGQAATVSFLERVDPSAPDGSTVVPTATVVRLAGLDHPSNNSTSLTTNVIALADVSVAMTGPTDITAGGNATYTITLTNNGPSDAQNVTFMDHLPAGMTLVSLAQTSGAPFSFQTPSPGAVGTASGTGTLPAGASAEFQLVGMLQSDVPAALNGINNPVTVSSTTSDDDPSNNLASVTSNVMTSADLAVSLIEPTSIVPGTLASYTLKITNNGPSDARNVSFNDALPPGMSLQSLVQTSGLWFGIDLPVSRSVRSVSGNRLLFPAGASASFTLTAYVSSDVSAASLTDTLDVATTTTDLNSSNNSASVTSPVHPQADLSVSLSTVGRAVAGTGFAYTITLHNAGPSVAQNVVVSEVLAPGVVFSSFGSSSTSGPYTASGPDAGTNGTVTFQIPSVGPYGFYGFTVNVAVPSNTPAGPLPSTVTVTSSTPDPNIANNTATDTITQVTTSADVSITDAQPMMFIDHGPVLHPVFVLKQNNTWVVDVTNSGPSDAQNVTWSSAVPAGVMVESVSQVSGPAFTLTTSIDGTGTVSGNIATLAAGQSAEFDLVFAQAGIAAGDTVSDTVTVTSDTADSYKYNNTSTATAVAYTPGDLAVSIQGPSTARLAGTYVDYIIDIKNDGQLLAGGATLNFDIPAGAQFNSITSSSGFPTLPNIPYGTTGPVSFALPAGMISGGDANIALQLYIEPNVPDGTILAPTATLTDTPASDDPSNNTASSDTLVLAQGDLAVTQTGPSSIVPGDTATYTFTIANNGPSYSQNVSFSDPLPAGMTFVSLTQTGSIFTLDPHPAGTGGTVSGSIATLRSGALTTFTLVARLDPSANGTSLTNTVTTTAATTDPNATNNSASVTTTILAPQADVAVTETGPSTVVPAGTKAAYNFKITNNGPSDAQNVSFSDPLPAGVNFVWLAQFSELPFTLFPPHGQTGAVSGNIAVLPAGATALFTLETLIKPSALGPSLTNTISASSSTPDPDTDNNAASVNTTVTPQADLSVGITSGNAIVGHGLTYTLTVSNNGPSDAQNVVLTQTLPAGISYLSMSQSTGPTSSFGLDSNGNVVANIATMPVGSFASYTVNTAVAVNAPIGPAPSTLSVTSTTTDTNLSNNSVTDTLSPITPNADLSASFIGNSNGGQIAPGQDHTFSFEVVNNGPSDAQNVSWSSAVPAGVSLVSVTQKSGPAFTVNPPASGTSNITGTIATLLSGQVATFDMVYQASPTLNQNVSSAVIVTSDTFDVYHFNNLAQTFAVVVQSPPPPADLAIRLASALSPVGAYAGSYITYTVDVANVGGTAAGTANVNYVIPNYAPFDTFKDISGFSVLASIPAGTTGPVTFILPAGLLPGHDAHITIGENISPSAPNDSVLTATATLSGLPTTDNSSNNTATVNTTVQTLADVAVAQTGPATVSAGSIANYRVTITNNGFSDSQNVSIAETLPQGIDAQLVGIVQNSGPAFTLGANGGSIATLPARASATSTISVYVGSDVTPGTVLTATAAATTLTADFNTSNNSAQTSTTVQAAQASMIAAPTSTDSTVSPTATVSPIHGFGRTVRTTLSRFSGVVAQFTDPTPTANSATALHFHVAINWGDGGLSAGTVTYDKTDGRWNVSASHRYKKKGTCPITVIVQDSAGRQGTITSHAIVGPMLVMPLTKQLV